MCPRPSSYRTPDPMTNDSLSAGSPALAGLRPTDRLFDHLSGDLVEPAVLVATDRPEPVQGLRGRDPAAPADQPDRLIDDRAIRMPACRCAVSSKAA